jgi:PAS domain S-box-containing protein
VPPADPRGTRDTQPTAVARAACNLGNEERFRLIIDSVRDYAIFMLDVEGRVTSWNAGAQQLKQYCAEEIVGQHFSVFYPADAIARGWPQDELGLAREHGRYEDEGWRVRKDGSTFWANVVITALYDEDGSLQGYAKISRDMTERKRMESLESASRRVTDLLAMLAHELRNPLAPMRNAAAVMREHGASNARVEWCREVIDRQVNQLSRLVDDLLDVGRITTGKIPLQHETLDVRAVIKRAVDDGTPSLASHGHVLEVVLPESPLWLRGDAARLNQVLLNLLDNAARYTAPGGGIRLTAEREGSHVVMRVIDTGTGIPAALLPQVFDIFVQGERTLDRPEGGLGLGLALVKNIVELHHGQVEARSDGPGRGTQITVRLPLAEPASPPAGPAPAARAAAEPRGRRVLVVDDNQDSADSMAMLLAMQGYTVRQAYHGREALDVAAEFEPEAVLLDIGLPEMSGYEVAAGLRRLPAGRDIMIIAMTGYGQDSDRERSAAAGFDHHLVKPVPLEPLHELLAAMPHAAQETP